MSLPEKSDFKVGDLNQHWLQVQRVAFTVVTRIEMIKRFARTFGNQEIFDDWRLHSL